MLGMETDPISKKDYERELDAANDREDADLFKEDTGHPDDFDPLGDGFTMGKAREALRKLTRKK